jgi:hypothetical protein
MEYGMYPNDYLKNRICVGMGDRMAEELLLELLPSTAPAVKGMQHGVAGYR